MSVFKVCCEVNRVVDMLGDCPALLKDHVEFMLGNGVQARAVMQSTEDVGARVQKMQKDIWARFFSIFVAS